MAKPKKMDDTELASLLDDQIADALSYSSSDLAKHRDTALAYYDGTMDDLPAETGKSSVVSQDLAEVVGWIMPGLMRVFLSGDKVAEYQPVESKDEEFAEDASEGINFLFLERCDGYSHLRSAVHDGLLLGNGILKHWWDDSECFKVETLRGISEDLYLEIVGDDDVEVLAHTEREEEVSGEGYGGPAGGSGPAPAGAAALPGAPGAAAGIPGELPAAALAGAAGGPGAAAGPVGGGPAEGPLPAGMADPALAALAADPGLQGPGGPVLPPIGPPPPVTVHDLKIKRREYPEGKLKVCAIPPEEFLLARDAVCLDETVSGCGHVRVVTRSELIKQGFDEDLVEELPEHSEAIDENTARSKRGDQAGSPPSTNADTSMQKVRVYEWYPLVDYDGDGVAERRKVLIGDLAGRGDGKERKILENTEWPDALPFTDLVPDPVPHRWRGRSLYDEIASPQQIKTVVWRQTLNNLYLTNNPMREVAENQVRNMETLVDQEIGGVVISQSGNAVRDLVTPFVAAESFRMLDYVDSIIEKRTGVSRASMSLDPNVLQPKTATQSYQETEASRQVVELYARNIAEGGMKRLFRCILKLVVKYQKKEFWIRRLGRPVQIDPRSWNADMDVSVDVGLGSGTKDRMMAFLNAIAAKQEQLITGIGPDNPLAGFEELRATYADMIETADLKTVEKYFKPVEPQQLAMWMQQKQAQPNPLLQVEQMKQQAVLQKAQMDGQAEQQKMQIGAQMKAGELQMNAQLQAQSDERKAQIEKVQAQADIAVKQQDAATNERLMMLEYELKKDLAMREEARKEREHQQKLAMLEREHEANLRFRTADQSVSHHFKAEEFAMKQAAQPNSEDK